MDLLQKVANNPELEALRLKALNSVNVQNGNSENDSLIERTSRIHAAFLFHSPKTLQPLLRAIGETKDGSNCDAGWQSFGDKLGLDVTILKVINNNHFNHEDPVYNTLLHYVQYEDATIGKILTALREIGRLDVVARCKAAINRDPSTAMGEVLIRPTVIPDAPFIMKNLQSTPLLSSLLLQGVTSARTNVICAASFTRALTQMSGSGSDSADSSNRNSLSHQEVVVVNSPVPAPRQYGKKVLLTFGDDGADFAMEVARVFRQSRPDRLPIGVLILEEQKKHLQSDPIRFINSAFLQVNYVVPILTEGYLSSVLKKVNSNVVNEQSADAQFVPFVYQLMVSYYIQNGCMNDKVRCLVPDGTMEKLKSQVMMAGPLFVVWEACSRADALATRILDSSA